MKLFARSLVRHARHLAALAFLATPAWATWSIVVVNTRTHEVAVASATCIPLFDLRLHQAVVRVGVGAAASQATIDEAGINRFYIWNGMQTQLSPAQMIQDLATLDSGHPFRQIGIATLYDQPISFTGASTSLANPQAYGEVGELRYAIQGNILAGDAVVLNAEAALLATPGDLSQKVMAAMEAARATGGDGRCSCSEIAPTSCGAPPPSFVYSAFTAYIIVARVGDHDGPCTLPTGCASGQYWCSLRVISGGGSVEPVLELQNRYNLWRNLQMPVRADQLLTRVFPTARRLPADGTSRSLVEVELHDIDGRFLDDTRAQVVATQVAGTPQMATLSDSFVVRPGVQRFYVNAGTQPGHVRFELNVVQEAWTVRLFPDLELDIDPAAELHSGFSSVSSSENTVVPFTLDLGAANAGRPYLLLGSASGTSPGVLFEGGTLPLNSDRIFRLSVSQPNNGRFQNTSSTLDGLGRAQARFGITEHLLDAFVGHHFDWCAVIFGQPVHFTNVAGFDLLP